MSQWLEMALRYVALGLPVLPLRPRSKEPWRRLQVYNASTDPAQIQSWAKHPDLNLGVAIPEGVVAIDVDPRSGGDVRLAELEKELGPLPSAARQTTGGGGEHILLRVSGDEYWLAKDAKQGVDLKQYGGYIVAAPSVHPDTGKAYSWQQLGEIPQAPEAWTGRYRSESARRKKVELAESDVTLTGEQLAKATELTRDAMVDGSKHHTLVALGGWLKQRGLTPSDATAIVQEVLPGDSRATDAVTWAYTVDGHTGYQQLLTLVGEDVMQEWEEAYPVPTCDAAADAIAELEALKQESETKEKAPVSSLYSEIDLWADLPEREYTVDGLPWHTGVLNALIGYAGDGKTPLAVSLACSLATGKEWLGRKVKGGKVLFLCYENATGTARLAQRCLRAMAAEKDQTSITFGSAPPGALLDLTYLRQLQAAASDYDHILVDTYNAAAVGADVKDSAFATPAKYLEVPGCAIYAVLHTRKSTEGPPDLRSISGTGAMAGAIKSAVAVHRPQDVQDEYTFELSCARAQDARFSPFRVRWANVPKDDDERWGFRAELVDSPEIQLTESVEQRMTRLRQVIASYYEGKNAAAPLRSLVAACKAPVSQVKSACASMVELGRLTQFKEDGELYFGTTEYTVGPQQQHEGTL